MGSSRRRRNQWLKTAEKGWVYVNDIAGVHVLCEYTMQDNGSMIDLYGNGKSTYRVDLKEKDQFIGVTILSGDPDRKVGVRRVHHIYSYYYSAKDRKVIEYNLIRTYKLGD